MPTTSGPIPPGPDKPYDTSEDLLGWMLENFARYGDIYRASVYGCETYVVNRPEYAQRILLDKWQNYLRKGQAVKRIALSLGNGLISSNGDFWVSQRRMIQPAFRHDAVGALLEVFMEPNVALLAKWRQAAHAAAEVNVTRDVSATVLEVTLRAIFGEDYAEVAGPFDIIAEESRNLSFARTCNALSQLVVRLAVRRRAAGKDAPDILGAMMRARDRSGGAPMPDAQLAREALTLVIAGHETTASVLNWIWYLLSRHPQVEARLADEVRQLTAGGALKFEELGRYTYTRQVLEEALRSYPPLWLITRRAVAPDRLGEYLVPKGTEVYISPFLLQRHPHLWQDPERFDPERFAGEESGERPRLSMCPFGAGPRNCIGEFFARVEMQIHMIVIARELRLRHEAAQPAGFVAGVNLLSRDNFLMRPELRSPPVLEPLHAAGVRPPREAGLAEPEPASLLVS
jgi:cytochrome P450